MNSIYGVIGQACHHFGWTVEYIVHEVDWGVVQRMLVDSPKVIYDREEEKQKKSTEVRMEYNIETAEQLMAKLGAKKKE